MKTFLRIMAIASMSALMVSCGGKALNDGKTDVIFDSDANNELDDQHAIAYLLLNEDTFNVLGITTNATKNGGKIEEQSLEAMRVISLVNKEGEVTVYDGANQNYDDIKGSLAASGYDGEPAVEFIVRQAKKYSPDNKLTVIAVGKLTNIALALDKDASVEKNVRLYWLGSNYPAPGEYNLVNDIPSMNRVLDSEMETNIVTVDGGTTEVKVSKTFVENNFAGIGPKAAKPVEGRHGGKYTCFGDYSVNLFEHINYSDSTKQRSLYDMAAVSIVKNPSWAHVRTIPAPTMKEGKWVERPEKTHTVKVWTDFDRDAIVEDFIVTLTK